MNDAHVLSPDADIEGGGETTKPRPGSPCLALMTSDGAQCFVIGFHRTATIDEESDEIPSVGNPEDNKSAGDKVYQTSGGARLTLKRGGSVIIEGGPGANIVFNPLNNRVSLRAANFGVIADGHRLFRGRKEIGKISPETIHEEDFQHQVGPTFDRFSVRHGSVGGDGRRELSLTSITVVASLETATIKTRETYFSDGSWVGEGPKYQWGGKDADQAGVLGNKLVDAISSLIDIIKGLKVNTAWGPSTPPLPPTLIALDQLKSELAGKILSTFIFLKKDPPEL